MCAGFTVWNQPGATNVQNISVENLRCVFESCSCFPLSKILKHEDLDGQIKTVCLGSLLLQDDLKRMEEQYLTHKEVKTSRALI